MSYPKEDLRNKVHSCVEIQYLVIVTTVTPESFSAIAINNAKLIVLLVFSFAIQAAFKPRSATDWWIFVRGL